MKYRNQYDFYRALPRLIEDGATLNDLHRAMNSIEQPPTTWLDGSPTRLRGLATLWTQWPALVPIRLTELFDGREVEHSDDYILAMIAGLGGRSESVVRAFILRNDHVLRDELFWRIFEVEGGGEISLANIDKFSSDEGNWHRTVVDLTADGTLDRARVLRSCLEALNRDFSAYRAGWFSRVYADLAPAPHEAASDQDLLFLTLGSSVTASASLAVKQLGAVHKAGLLDAPAFVESCPPALTGPKTSATIVLRMLTAIGAEQTADAAAAIAQAMAHPHADVQRAAVKALRTLGRDDLVQSGRDLVSPAVAADLVHDSDAGSLTVVVLDSAAPPLVAQPTCPWTDEDAQERFAALLEDSSDAIEFELALAWLAASDHAGEVLTPLEKRARKLHADDEQHFAAGLALAIDPEIEFLPQTFWRSTTVVVENGETVIEYGEPEPRRTAEQVSVLPSFIARLREVAAVAQGLSPRRPLLATPTDTHGWIDADVLLERFQTSASAASSAGIAPLPADLAQAVLRVHPDRREQVRAALGTTHPRITDALRIEWCSSGSDTTKADGSPKWVWWSPFIHAESAEAPSAEHPALIPSTPVDDRGTYRGTTDLVTAQLGLVHPPSTLPLTAVGVGILNNAVTETSEHQAPAVLTALATHPGEWTSETAQLVALGMSAAPAELRAHAVELFAAAVPARVSPSEASRGFAACAPACIFTRWAASFTDAATLVPVAVVDVLTALLPGLDRTTRGIGALLTVLLDESIRLGREVSDAALREWLDGFTGSSAAAKTARRLLG